MNETLQMEKEIRRLTLALTFVLCGLTLLFHGSFRTISAGIIIGSFCGIIGFSMIRRMASRIEQYGDAKAKGYQAYVKRYAFYTLVFALSAYRGVNIIALLAGMLTHKGAIVLYTFLHRKEVD